MLRHHGAAFRSAALPTAKVSKRTRCLRRRSIGCFVLLMIVIVERTLYLDDAENLIVTFALPTSRSGGQKDQMGRPASIAANKTVTTWAGTSRGKVCHQLFRWKHEGEDLSYMVAWEKIHPAVLNASYYPPRFANESRFRSWVSDLFGFYTHERLQRSQAHPAPRESIRKIWDVLERRIRDPAVNEPVRIAVFGGSVTVGRECDQNPLDLPGTNEWGEVQEWCSYAHRLDVLLNEVLFPNRSQQDKTKYPLFEVINVAAQATNSEVGAMAMEYNLLPVLEDLPPHIVISSYSANDAEDDEEPTFWKHQQSFVRAAHSLRPCDDHLPLVVLSDDWFTHDDYLTLGLVNTGSLFKTATWHNVMAVMYANVVRSAAIFHSNFTDSEKHPLFGSARWGGSHLGMGFHIAQGITLFFNLVGALHDACTEPQHHDDHWSASSSPALAEGLPTKYMGRYAWEGKLVLRDWEENAKFNAKLCSTATGPTKRPRRYRVPYSTPNCPYAWMVNYMTNIWEGYEVQGAVDHVLVDQAGWDVDGETPKAGWRTNLTRANLTDREQSHFSIELRNITQPVDTFTLLSLKSYGPEWVDSRLLIDIRVVPARSEGVGSGVGGPEELPEPVKASVDGYHAKEISVSYPHRFPVNAQAGDTIAATFTLESGKNFKISGMAFCRSMILTSETW